MNDPIISPFWIYLMGNTAGIATAMAIMPLLVFVYCLCVGLYKGSRDPRDDGVPYEERDAVSVLYRKQAAEWYRRCRVWAAVFLVGCTAAFLMPDRNTIIGMVVASKTTPATIDKTGTWVDSQREVFKQDLIDVIKALDDDEQPAENE